MVPGKAEPCPPAPGTEYCGLNCAKLVPNAAGNCPPVNPAGNCAAAVIWFSAAAAWPLCAVTRRERMERSDIWSRCATGGIRATEAGSRETSDFMSERSSSSWFSTLCRTAFAGLLPARDSLERCWWDSARHST